MNADGTKLLWHFLLVGNRCVEWSTLKKKKRKNKKVILCRRRKIIPIDNVLLMYDNARLHKSIRTRETINSFGWTTLLHHPYSLNLAPSDYHLFSPMKEGLRGRYYVSDEEVKTTQKKWLKEQPIEFFEAGIHPLIRRWNIVSKRNGNHVEK